MVFLRTQSCPSGFLSAQEVTVSLSVPVSFHLGTTARAWNTLFVQGLRRKVGLWPPKPAGHLQADSPLKGMLRPLRHRLLPTLAAQPHLASCPPTEPTHQRRHPPDQVCFPLCTGASPRAAPPRPASVSYPSFEAQLQSPLLRDIFSKSQMKCLSAQLLQQTV